MHFPNLPLYSQLKKDDFKELTDDQKNDLLEKIKSMSDDEQKEKMIFALIFAYHLEHDNNMQDIPYNGKMLKGGLKLDIDSIPSKLQHILYSFSMLN